MTIVPGRRFGPYILERRIAKGGMGDVWVGVHDRLRRHAVVKLILPHKLVDVDRSEAQTVIERFEREAAATAALTSPHTVRLYDFGVSEDGLFYQVMELLDGCTLTELRHRAGPLGVGRTIHLLRQACESLGEAHRLGMVHRDIKPANLFVCTVGLRRDFLKVLDFGLVLETHRQAVGDDRLTQANVLTGTPGFIAPEAITGVEAVDARFDVYALGCVAHELITGERLFSGVTPYEVFERHVNETPLRLDTIGKDVPRDFADVVARCLEKKPEHRPADALVLEEMLAACSSAGEWSDTQAERWWLGSTMDDLAAPDDDEDPTEIVPPRSGASGSQSERASLVVLPFRNRSNHEEDDFLGEGLAEDLITELSKIESLTVISRNSSRTQPDNIDARSACAEFKVRYALEGSIRRAGDRLRVTARLTEGATGECLWADKYDRELEDIFALQDDLVACLVEALSLRLTEGDRSRRGVQGTDSMEALEAAMRAREELLKQNRAAMERAKELLQHAIDLDPAFARPYGTLAAMYILEVFDGTALDPLVCLDRARRLAHAAVTRDPNNPDAIFSLGFLALLQHRHDDAMRFGHQLVRLDPAWGHLLLANVLHYTGRDEVGLDHVKRAMRLDPRYPDITLLFLGLAHYGLGQYEEAAAAFVERSIRNPTNDSTFMLVASTLGRLGRTEEAREAWARCKEITPSYSLAHRQMVLPYRDADTFQRVVEGLRLAGIETELDD